MKRLASVFVFCVAIMSILNGDLFASQCPSCVDAQSNACRRWGSGRAKFQWASGEDVSSSITLTAGSCGQCGESGVGYIFMDCDTHSATCNGSSNSPCDDGMTSIGAFAIVKVTGNKKAFQNIFPGGIGFTGDKTYSCGDGCRTYRGVSVDQANCEYQVPLGSAGHPTIKVSASVSNCDAEYDNSRFNIQVKFFETIGGTGYEDHYTLLATTTGSITVKRNDKRNFNAVNFVPDLRDGSALSNMKELYRAYNEEGGQSEWMINYRGGTWDNCESKEGWCGVVATSNATLVPEDATFYRVKYPGWKESANGQPPYTENTGWDYDEDDNRLVYSMGDMGKMYYHCATASDGSVRVRTVERCDEGEDAGEGQVQWTIYYDNQNRIKYIHNASYTDPNNPPDPNSLDDATVAYEYDYSGGDGNDPNVIYKTRPDTQSSWQPERQWSLEFDGNDQVIKYIGGCSSCTGSGSFEHIQYHDTYTDQILWQKNADGDIIVQNDYEVIEYGEYEPAGYIYIPDGGFETQNVATGQCEPFENQYYGWYSGNQTITAQICDPNFGNGQYLKLDDASPDTLYQDLYAVMPNTVYDLDVEIRGHIGETQSEATITLYAFPEGVGQPIELAVIDVNDFDLPSNGSWDTKSLQWDSAPYSDPDGPENYLTSYADPWYLQIEVTGDKVDIDEFHMATSVWVGGQSKALIKEQKRMDPTSGELVTILKRDYDQPNLKLTERNYVSSNVCRLVVYEYEDEAFTNIIKKTEYEETGTDTSLPIGSSYETTYTGDDPNEIFITNYPNGKRADYQRFENGNLVESYVIDLDNDVNSLRETYTYVDVENSENYITNPPDWRLETYTNARGGVTQYEYETITQSPYSFHLLKSQTDPNTSAGQQEIIYTYDDARRIIKEVSKLDNDRNLKTEYDYNPATGYLDSVTANGARTSYKYNRFGQVIRQTNPDGIMTGKSYGLGGELVSEFVISTSSADPNGADSSLALISQIRYTYTDDGKIELIGQYKSDTSFSYQSLIDADSSNWLVTKYEYYDNGQKKKLIEDFGTGKTNLTTEYFYNFQGELEKVLYPTGKWVKTIRNGRGQVVLEQTGYGTDTVVLEAAYSYDANGNLEQQSDPDGSILIYTYDNYDRLKRTYKCSTSGPYTEKFYNNAGDVVRQIACEADGTILSDSRTEYDDLGNVAFERRCFEPNSIDNDSDFTSHYLYDIAGNLRFDIKAAFASAEPNAITTEYLYDKQGRRTQTIDPNGIIHSIFYTEGGLPKTIVDPNDPVDPNAFITENFYDAYGRLEKSIDPMGHYTEYTYNSLNQVTQQIMYDCNETPLDTGDDFVVRQRRTEYDNLGNVTRQAVMADPDSGSVVALGVDLVTNFIFDPNDGLLKQQKSYYGTIPTTASTSYIYDSIGRRIQTTDPEGNQQTTTYYSDDEKNALVQKVEQKEVDSENSQTYYTITTFFNYDEFGRLSARILDEDGDGTLESTDPNTSFTYDALDRLETNTAPDGVVTYYEYDGFGNVKTKIEDYDDGTPDIDHDRKTEFVYNYLNRQYQVKAYDPNNTTSHIAVQITTYEYDKNGNVTQITYPDDKYVTYTYNLLNKVDTETQRDGTEIYYWYDWKGHLVVESDDPEGWESTSYPDLLTEFQYDAIGQLTYAYKQIEGQEVSESSFIYNGFGVKTSETAQYDNDFTKTTYWTYDGSGNVLNQIHGDTTLTYTHDGLGRIKTIDKGNDEIVSYTYLGRNTDSVDYPEADTTQYFAYDELGRIEECESIDSSDVSILDFEYTYDEVGNRESCEYSHLSPTVFDVYEYDDLRRLKAVTYADDDGYVALATDNLSMGDLVLYASTWVNNESIDFADYAEFKAYKHEVVLAQRLEQMRVVLKEAGYRDIDSFLKSVKGIEAVAFNPDEPIYTFAVFDDDIPNNYTTESVTNDNGDVIAQIIWDNKGRMVLFAMYPDSGDTVVVIKSYDNQGNLTADTITVLDADGNVSYTEDMLAQEETLTTTSLSASTMSLTTTSISMSSSPEAPANKSEEFVLDHLGNRYQYTDKLGYTTTYTHNSVNQYSQSVKALPWVGNQEQSFTYDDNGNLTEIETDYSSYGYTFDYRNRLVEVHDANSVTQASYVFDALGRRIYKEVGSTRTYFFYDIAGRVIAEYEDDTAPALKKEYVWGNQVNEVLAMFTPYYAGDPDDWDDFVDFCSAWLCVDPNDACYDANYDHDNDDIVNFEDFAYFAGIWDIPSYEESDWYYLHDALGSVRGLVGGRFQRESDRKFYNYDVYGNLSIQDEEESKSGNTILFAGYRYDPETELYHTEFRAYDPEMGRWLQFDRNYYDSWNLYEYVMSNPTNYLDPYGLASSLSHPKSLVLAVQSLYELGMSAKEIAKIVGVSVAVVYAILEIIDAPPVPTTRPETKPVPIQKPTPPENKVPDPKPIPTPLPLTGETQEPQTDTSPKCEPGDCDGPIYPGDGMKPPGDCTEDRYKFLREAVKRLCKKGIVKGCKRGIKDECVRDNQLRLGRIEACIKAREALDKECFRGGDRGHNIQRQQLERMRDKCLQYLGEAQCTEVSQGDN